jgi:histidinol-phosphate aminotransferase
MDSENRVSRRTFVGAAAVTGVAGALGYLGLRKSGAQSSASAAQAPGSPAAGAALAGTPAEQARAAANGMDYDALAKLSFNENPYGPPESVMKAMTGAFKYANRYGYPDGGIVDEIAKHHGVKSENILLGAGSGEILDVVGTAFLEGHLKVVGVEPSYTAVYQHATSIRADAIRLSLLPDYRQDMSAIVHATKMHYRDVGFVYLCNPNNPTGRVVTKQEIKLLLDGLPDDMPVLIDEAYHHFVEHRDYATSVPYVLEGRPVIVTRTFSKIVGLAGMRLGYAVAPRELIDRMRPFSIGSVNAIVKWGGVAALKDTEAMARVKKITLDLRKKTTGDLTALGYDVIPSETNFFMVAIKRPVQPVISAFKDKGVLVGRPFPPMTEHLRVSVGTAEEMSRFIVAFKEIFAKKVT